MNAKDTVSKGYDCFGKGDMETFFTEVIHDDCVWTHPGVPGKHPLSGVHNLSLIHISEPTRLLSISYAVFCLKKK